MENSANQTTQNTYPFEGCEKRLFIAFKGRDDLRDIPKTEWDQILKHAQCTILNTITNNECIAHLLSESSLFIFKHTLMIKTCGTTTLLNIIPILLQMNYEIADIFYSHSNFMFPRAQPRMYRLFGSETQYLNEILNDTGVSVTLGSAQNQWHCYRMTNGHTTHGRREKTLEIVMFDLNPECMRYFFDKNGFSQSDIDKYVRDNCSIPKTAIIDTYVFKPCGYSLNGLLRDRYWSIHITPESEGSFVSFETNYDYGNGYESVIDTILKTFKPKRFGFAMNEYSGGESERFNFDGFGLMNSDRFRFSKEHKVSWLCYEYRQEIQCKLLPIYCLIFYALFL